MPAQHITDAQFQSLVLESKIPVVVDFYAEWCGPCKQASPIIDALAEEMKDKVLFVKMDVDKNSETPAKYGVMSIPTMVVFKNGQEATRKVGFGGEASLRAMIASL